MSNLTKDQTKELLRPEFTLVGRAFWPNVLGLNKDGKFGVQFAFDPNDPRNAQVYQQLQQHVENAKNQIFGSHQQFDDASRGIWGLTNPIRCYNTYRKRNGQPNGQWLQGLKWIDPKTGQDFPPRVIKMDNAGNMIEIQQGSNDPIVYSGANAICTFSLYASVDPQKKMGFGTNFSGIMFIGGGDKIEGERSDPREAFGKFMGMTGGFGQNPGNPPPQNNQQGQQGYGQQGGHQQSQPGQGFGNQGHAPQQGNQQWGGNANPNGGNFGGQPNQPQQGFGNNQGFGNGQANGGGFNNGTPDQGQGFGNGFGNQGSQMANNGFNQGGYNNQHNPANNGQGGFGGQPNNQGQAQGAPNGNGNFGAQPGFGQY